MPFKSKAQQRFLEAHPEKIGGPKALKEWEGATDFKHLPERARRAASERGATRNRPRGKTR